MSNPNQPSILLQETLTGPPVQRNLSRLEIDNAYLTQQNEHLHKELSFARYTVNALKTITLQKDHTLNETRQELDRAYLRIRMLGMALQKQQQQLQLYTAPAGPGALLDEENDPMLIADGDDSSDEHEEEEEETADQGKSMDQVTSVRNDSTLHRSSDIIAKLPLRAPVGVYDDTSVQQLTTPPDSPRTEPLVDFSL
ncbi:uncharacterized protein BYT42DRAFT_358877 [Radiomyces spectabilis]|uniref:uncharacterized protein n=1 Tax=Radiomyces spectabilis TaxID=64574 RepID=UPI00221F12A3|nr:uncharacterized protein BYT42DRAFT_358877 [Radiomyces spectabilis]KAI8377828.1 hypothetical protein BYT42DRAFT_358877 [Radiomyces spectabilis]